ncbi:MAG: hypothetical protein EHM20_14815 [Alphaproteobacteria bacterium]|nr:MAG: hypothetical protein EHM20_14815 [Alphaproteobacteria bacterium]
MEKFFSNETSVSIENFKLSPDTQMEFNNKVRRLLTDRTNLKPQVNFESPVKIKREKNIRAILLSLLRTKSNTFTPISTEKAHCRRPPNDKANNKLSERILM